MLEEFIDATVKKKVWRLGYSDDAICSENSVNRGWLEDCLKPENYTDEDSLQCYEVEDKIFEIITKIYALSVVGLSKDEIVKNLKKKYNEDDINAAISFLKNNNLIDEYLCILYRNEVIMEIGPRDIWYEDTENATTIESKKFYTAKLYYTQDIAKIGSKTPETHPSYKLFGDPYYFHISSTPLCFENVPKDRWKDIELLSPSNLYQRIQFDIINKFLPQVCVIENRFVLGCFKGKTGLLEEEIIDHKDRGTVKEKLLKRVLKKIKLLGGKNIVVKDKGPLEVNVKYTFRKEILLPILTSYSAWYVFSKIHGYFYFATMQKNGYSWELCASSNFANAIRKRKKGEKDDYFFIDDESEEFDDIIIEDTLIYNFPCDFKTKFIDYVTKRFKSVGVKIKVIHKKFEKLELKK